MFDGSVTIAWAFFGSSVLAFELAMHAWPKRRNAYSNAFFTLMIFAGFWSLLSGLHLVISDFELKVLVSDIKFLFIAPFPVVWALMAAWYADINVPRRVVMWLFVIPATTLILIATNSWHGVVFSESELFVLEGFTPSHASIGSGSGQTWPIAISWSWRASSFF